MSGRQRFRSAAERQNGVGLTPGMLHLIHPLRPGPDMLENHLVDESLVDGWQHGRGCNAGDGSVSLQGSGPVEHRVTRSLELVERLTFTDADHRR
jgi:hypothetical protein